MARTITVKGTGKVSVPPDYIVLTFKLETIHCDYCRMLEESSARFGSLCETTDALGFAEDALKTQSYKVSVVNKSVRDKDDIYKEVFQGYKCLHKLSLSFDFDAERFSQVLTAVSQCSAKPSISIDFTVKDSDAVKEELLRAATRNARQKAEILTSEANVKLGQLLAINYDWTDIQLVSKSDVDGEVEYFDTVMELLNKRMTPDTITVSDNAAFVWEIM